MLLKMKERIVADKDRLQVYHLSPNRMGILITRMIRMAAGKIQDRGAHSLKICPSMTRVKDILKIRIKNNNEQFLSRAK